MGVGAQDGACMALPCVGCISKTPGPARPEDSTGVTPCLSAGAWPQGAPFPCSIAHWLCSNRALRGGAHWLGMSRGAHVHSKTSSRVSLERHSLTSVARDPDQVPWPGNPDTEAERGQGRLPGPLAPRVPLLGGCPLRDLIGAGRKAQAGGPEGGGLVWGRVEALGHTGQELPRHGGPSFQEKRVCPCLSYQAWVHGSVV